MKRIFCIFLVAASLLTTKLSAAQVQDFSAEDLHGKTQALDSLLGEKITIVSFWGTTCLPCKGELAFLDSLYGVYADSGLSVIAISVDSKRSLSKVAPMVTSYGWDFPVLTDPDGDLVKLFKVNAIPHSLYLGPDKALITTKTGFTAKDKGEITEIILEAIHADRPLFTISEPAPIRRSSSIELAVVEELEIDVAVIDTAGSMLKSLFSGVMVAGNHVVNINASDLPAGSYIVVVKSGEDTQTVKLLIED